MRYPPEHKTRARANLVRAGAKVTKRAGFAATGIDALAAAAGVTSGSVYRHFRGKDELLRAIVETDLELTRARFAGVTTREAILRAVALYLSLAHVRAPDVGCLLPALAPEVGRASTATKAAFEAALTEIIEGLAVTLGDRPLAAALVAQCAGAVMLARAMASEEAQRAILDAAHASVRAQLAAHDGDGAPPARPNAIATGRRRRAPQRPARR